MEKRKVGVIGATGMVGQRFLTLLDDHPYFEVTALAASARSAGKTYREAVGNRWKLKTPMPAYAADMLVHDAANIDEMKALCDMVFCAVDMKKEDIRALEDAYAKAEIPVVSNNSAHRWTPDVPMVIPEINDAHLAVIDAQRKRLGTKRGFVAVKPNCSIQSYVPMLSALLEFEPYEVVATTYQAISGAGKTFNEWPEMIDNVIPFIGGEEEKSEQEPLRVWGKVENGEIVKREGITIILAAWKNFKGKPQELALPHAPEQFITYFEEDNRPQAAVDRDIYGGMGVTVGRLREDAVYDYKFVGLSHNTLRGAAGGAVLIAELLHREGYFD